MPIYTKRSFDRNNRRKFFSSKFFTQSASNFSRRSHSFRSKREQEEGRSKTENVDVYIFPLEILSTRSPFRLFALSSCGGRESRKADVILVHDRLEASRLEPEVDGRFTQLPAEVEPPRGTVTRRDATKEAGPPRIKLRSFASSRCWSASHRFGEREREKEHHPVSGLPSLSSSFLDYLLSLSTRNFLSRYDAFSIFLFLFF